MLMLTMAIPNNSLQLYHMSVCTVSYHSNS